jgi:NAD(P) transhydrogenase
MEDFDLVVIGSGPAGEKGAAMAAYHGKRVALVERRPTLGGTAANAGTLSSKTLRETALYFSGFRQRGLYGVEMTLDRALGVRDLLHRERQVHQSEQERIEVNLARHGVEVVRGTARFLDAHTVQVASSEGTRQLTGRAFLVATGSVPYRPPLFPFEAPHVYDSDEILQLTTIPRSLTVVGGGVIGCEYACLFAALGLEVTVVDAQEPLLAFLDSELARVLQEQMQRLGVRFVLPDAVQRVEVTRDEVTLVLASGRTLTTQAVLVASGRTGATAGLGLEALGVGIARRGFVEVNAHLQTAVPHIYAAGDVVGFPALASTAMEQGRVAVAHAFGLEGKEALAPVLPFGLYTIPEASCAGETEEALKQKGIPYVVGRATYAQNARGQIIGDGGGFLKLLFHRDSMKLLGVHIVGEQASELVHLGLTALLMGAGADLFIHTCFNHPTLSECYKLATYDALGQRKGRSLIHVKPLQTNPGTW